ncbi:hypothetical protein GR157_01885 [Burkholderia sp. 4701]|nr:hypothetical protein [Burkholderia sp. 4701]MXN81185.1 hypothetical protein [Burkholderia sp. 4812]
MPADATRDRTIVDPRFMRHQRHMHERDLAPAWPNAPLEPVVANDRREQVQNGSRHAPPRVTAASRKRIVSMLKDS